MRENTATKKLVMAGVLTALAVVGSLISFPIAGSKCAPVQHMVNILAAVTLGPGWGVGIAFTDPWSHGWLSTLREGIAWAFGLYYLFFGAFTITVPAIRTMSAFAHSPQKLKELPLLLWFLLPFFISVASVAAFFYGYLGHHY